MVETKPIQLIEFIVNLEARNYSDKDWELLVRQARTTGLLSRLDYLLTESGLVIPEHVKQHLNSANKFWKSQKRILDWELHNLKGVFNYLDLPLILLKGTAYSAANLRAGFGRVFSDIDILVPEQSLNNVTELLRLHGWFPEALDNYDKRYYTQWMHELPPFRHLKTGTTLDVHHNILPRTCKLSPDSKELLKKAVYIPNKGFWTLSAEDMVLHSATHLFWGGEFDNAFRDLSDLDLLLREFSSQNDNFWNSLLIRAEQVGLREPVFYALNYTYEILGTPLPQNVLDDLRAVAKPRLTALFFKTALLPYHSSCNTFWTEISRWCLYVRSHWLKMPWYLLLPHLSRKTWMRLTSKEKQ